MSLSHLLLHVQDLEAAEDFYCGKLGCRVRARDRLRDGRPLLVLAEGIGLAPYPPGSVPPATPNVEHIALRVSSLTPYLERFQAAGLAFEGPVASERYGRSLYVRDPDGNRIELHDQ